jgi:Fe-S cluster biogenesis protein NfuA
METAFKDKVARIDALAVQIRNAADAETRTAALELLQIVMDFHYSAIDRMMEIAAEAGDAGWSIIDSFGQDEIVSNVLLLHNLHPLDLETRVRDALTKVRPYLGSHGGNVELAGVEGGRVRLRLIGSCNGCPSSTMTLKSAIEKAIYDAAPDVTSIECEGALEAGAA